MPLPHFLQCYPQSKSLVSSQASTFAGPKYGHQLAIWERSTSDDRGTLLIILCSEWPIVSSILCYRNQVIFVCTQANQFIIYLSISTSFAYHQLADDNNNHILIILYLSSCFLVTFNKKNYACNFVMGMGSNIGC